MNRLFSPAGRTSLSAGLLLLLTLSLGCKSKEGGSAGMASRTSDPLFGGTRIPRQDLPIPGRGDALASRDRRDPLTDPGVDASATPPPDRTEQAGTKPRDGKTASLGRSPYRPDRTATTAAMAAPPTNDGELSIGTRPGTPSPSRGTSATWTLDELLGELTRLGVNCGYPEKEGAGYVLRGDVTLTGAREGQLRRYEGTGRSPSLAARSLLDQVREDTARER